MSEQGPSIAERYHEATKYAPETIAQSRHELDWSRKPALFKEYEDAEKIALMPQLIGRSSGPVTFEDIERALLAASSSSSPRATLGLAEVARLLYLTNGITRIVAHAGPSGVPEPFRMRAAPSAGGLYPTEIYVVAREGAVAALPAGAWNLNVRDLALARADDGAAAAAIAADRVADATGTADLVRKAALVVVLTGIFERSGWRYEERAYRRICLDTGHVLGNLVLAAERLGLRAVPIGGFLDGEIEDALGLDATDEGALVVVPILPSELADETLRPRGARALKGPLVRASSESTGKLGLMRALHLATRLEPPIERAAGRDAPGDSYLDGALGAPLALPDAAIDWSGGALERAILARRSTRAFTGEAFTLAEVAAILGDAYLSPAKRAPERFIDISLLETFVVLTRCEDAEPGVYRFDPRERALRLIAPGARTREAHAICLGQELGRDAAMVVVHTVDLPRAIARYGDRAYRYAHLDAGHVGERLNLAALKLGLGASGIGGFFDDQTNALLGLPLREAIVYLTTLGHPSEEELA